MDVLTMINGSYPSLTKAEKKIAQYVLVNSEDVEQMSISELAVKAEVAETTVIRFCRKLNFKGYQDFKLSLARDLATNRARLVDGLTDSSSMTSEYIEYLDRFNTAISQDKLHEIAMMMNQAHSICIFGAGVSAIVGTYLKSRLIRMGIPVIFDADIHLQAIDIAVLHADDMVIAISTSGNTTDLLRNVEIVKRSRIPVVSISNYLNSKLSEISNLALIAPSGSGRDSSDFLPVLGQLAAIDLICQELQTINPERTKILKERINETLINRIE
ncbi:MurR/RpiR family transcriptional regulator [Latilactobacillus fuchuensis]|uniref:MurR/RpiR family transcriptional regulator n=1 Tax=Latilactobacillus fuchuensis TaxID=164393 RepID=UPI0039AF04C5